ncbi:protein-L-isoaspartate O-methyltransferase domain-containing protein 1-like [Pollicipes pollicipes]|uniref:protein-L-isoaspartate O-methyltransferase domain-containing protein 1-like n=1 Tax=Pollicipes pollicipes TaxID=41117 RepID=UPI0018849495|nr:protein-L-isoaspartate O-methyltransferase domain-containing protein 1-like [Pollicipes pollicipes]XP_037068343.1 protein-L-isoaspartate O-methyltransferase domain-containing protein 1-like [Pollicipes pollicipes]
MGGAVSTGEDNDDLVDNLVEHACITSCRVERVFRAVDRGHYFTDECRESAYKDTAWRSDNLHLSAPCIYSSVMENLTLKPGHSFLNIGSGTGYVSTMVGLMIGSQGVNHGVELFQDVIDYARQRLDEFSRHSSAIDQFDFCPPQFVCGNGLLIGVGRQYDRVYCGARCPTSELPYLKQLLKVGGVLVVPIVDHLKRIERLAEDRWDVQNKLSVSFAPLIEPRVSDTRPSWRCLP